MVIKADKAFLWLAVFVCTLLCFPVVVVSQADKNNSETLELPIIMYHQITENPEKCGKYSVLLSEFEGDLEYLRKNGYTTILVSELYDFVCGDMNLPDKTVMLTFDDGFESVYKLCYPLLKKYGMKAVAAVIGVQCELYSDIDDHNINYSNMNWDAVYNLNHSGLVEIANHSYDLHHNEKGERKGMTKLKNETQEQYEDVIRNDIGKMQLLLKQRAGVNAKTIAYPYGAYNQKTNEIMKSMGFICSFTCEEKIYVITKNQNELFGLGRFNRPSGVSGEDFFADILK